MYKFKIYTDFNPVPYNIRAEKYKIKKGFLTLTLLNSKIMCFNINKLDMFSMEEEK